MVILGQEWLSQGHLSFMANTNELLQNLILSTDEIRRNNPDWTEVMIRDYETLSQDLTLLANTNDINAEQVEINKNNIASNTTAITANTLNISMNANGISINAGDIATNSADIANHIALNSAHGVSGDNVGTGNFCTLLTGGVVLLSALVNDAIQSTVSVTSPDASAAPVAYDQAQIQEIVNLANEMKADINTLVSDVNNAIVQLNDFIAKNQAANQMDT